MRRIAPNVVRWVERMRSAEYAGMRRLLSDDRISRTLLPVLTRMMKEQLPVLAGSARIPVDRIERHPGERIPRALGSHAFELEGRTGKRIVCPYSLWMLQRRERSILSLRTKTARPRTNLTKRSAVSHS